VRAIDSTLKEWRFERTKDRDSTKINVNIGKGLFKGSMWFNILPNMEYVLARYSKNFMPCEEHLLPTLNHGGR
jgi:hypothetical protein